MPIYCALGWLLLVLTVACKGSPAGESGAFPARIRTVIDTPRIEDGRARFREIFCGLLQEQPAASEDDAARPSCEELLPRLVDEPPPSEEPRPWQPDESLRIVVVPGLFNECISDAQPFQAAVDHLRHRGFKISMLVVSGRSSADFNAGHIADYVETLRKGHDERLVLVGYSKGAVDNMHFLVNHEELRENIGALVSVAGAVHGSPLAERFADLYAEFAAGLPYEDCATGDAGALESLRPSVRTSWLARNPLPASVRYFSLVTFTDRAHVSPGLASTYGALADLDPRNDGQLLAFDQILPGATLLAYAKADHWQVALPWEQAPFYVRSVVKDNHFPREVLLEAIVLYVAEALRDGTP